MELRPINLVPWGLANLFGLKTDTGIIAAISDVMVPVLPVLDIFAATNCLETVVEAVNYSAVGSNAFLNLTVPVDQMWLVRGAGFSAQTGAAEVIRGRMVHLNSNLRGINNFGIEGASSLTDAAGVGVCEGGSLGAFMMAPGDTLRFICNKITTAGNISVAMSAVILRFHA
jgi:hypothetical protein